MCPSNPHARLTNGLPNSQERTLSQLNRDIHCPQNHPVNPARTIPAIYDDGFCLADR